MVPALAAERRTLRIDFLCYGGVGQWLIFCPTKPKKILTERFVSTLFMSQ
jgi:hypothetical protein